MGGGEFSAEIGYDTHFNHVGHPITFSSGDGGYGVEVSRFIAICDRSRRNDVKSEFQDRRMNSNLLRPTGFCSRTDRMRNLDIERDL
jgi:hypothetical protein